MSAAKAAGLNVRHIIDEPTAAALYYAFKSGDALGGIYAVYDLGGGTFDISIIKVSGHDIEVLASNGVARLGGDDFDKAIIKVVAQKYETASGQKFDPADYQLSDAEADKKDLSRQSATVARVGREVVEITQEEFNAEIASLLSQTELLCEAAIEEAGVSLSDITGVMLAGGSTRIPAVIQSVTKTFDQKPMSALNVDEVVALGAALYAAHRGDKTHLTAAQTKAIDGIRVAEIANEYFGTISVAHNQAKGIEERINSIVIAKGTRIPCEVTNDYYTMGDGQTAVHCVVTQSKSHETDPRFVKTVWEGELELPAGRPAGQRVDVTFGFNENQIMLVSYKDVASGKELKVTLDNISVSEDVADEIKKFEVQ
jgi:molecular chaperone DnaK